MPESVMDKLMDGGPDYGYSWVELDGLTNSNVVRSTVADGTPPSPTSTMDTHSSIEAGDRYTMLGSQIEISVTESVRTTPSGGVVRGTMTIDGVEHDFQMPSNWLGNGFMRYLSAYPIRD